jgi:hypothetical protein
LGLKVPAHLEKFNFGKTPFQGFAEAVFPQRPGRLPARVLSPEGRRIDVGFGDAHSLWGFGGFRVGAFMVRSAAG